MSSRVFGVSLLVLLGACVEGGTNDQNFPSDDAASGADRSDLGAPPDAGDGGVAPVDGGDAGTNPDAAGDGGATDTDSGTPPPDKRIVINEIMYHPLDTDGEIEFLELFNAGAGEVLIGGLHVEGFAFDFPIDARISAGEYLVIAHDAAAFSAKYGFQPDYVTTGRLSNSGELLILEESLGGQLDLVEFTDQPPWPVSADGSGPSLELISPLLDNRLPENWSASVMPTPKAQNSVYQEILGPRISTVRHPIDPDPNTSLPIRASISDATSATLFFVFNFEAEDSLPMTRTGTVFEASLPGQAASTLVRIRVEATGPAGSASWPRSDDTVTYGGFVVRDPAVSTALPLFQWFMAPDRYQAAIDHRHTDDLEPAVFYYDGVLYDNVQVRVKGQSSRDFPKNHWKFKFPRGHDFDHPRVMPAPVDQFNLQSSYADKAYARDLLAFETVRDAGMPYSVTFHVRVQQNGQFYGLYTFVEDFDAEWLERNGLDDRGAWYESTNGDGSSLPLGNIEFYYEKVTRETEPYQDLVDLLYGVETSGAGQHDFLADNFDIPKVVNYLAVLALIHDNDQASKNYYLYRDTNGTQRWSFHAWDLDLTFGRNYDGSVLNDTIWADDDLPDPGRPWVSPSHPLFGDQNHQKWDEFWNRLTDALHAQADFRQMFYRRLRTLSDQMLAGNRYPQRLQQLRPLLAPEAALDVMRWGQYGAQQDLLTAQNIISNDYLPRRRTHLLTTHRVADEVPAAQSAAPNIVINEIMYQPGAQPGEEFVELFNPSANEAVDLSRWRVDGLDLVLPSGAVILPREYLLVVKNDVAFRGVFSGRFVAAQTAVELADTGATIVLRDAAGRVVDQVTFSNASPWPNAAGNGMSLELRDAASDNALPASWSASNVAGGSPGLRNTTSP